MPINALVPAVCLEDVLITEELTRRPAPPPHLCVENATLHALANAMVHAPESMLQTLADSALKLCNAESAGISLLDERAGVFRLAAAAGACAGLAGSAIPAEPSPCGTCLRKGSAQLFSDPSRLFGWMRDIPPAVSEALVVPFRQGETAGTIWVLAHKARTKFTAEDARILTSLADFTAAVLERDRTTATLAKTDARLRFALNATHFGEWDLNVETGVVAISPQHARIFGYASPPTWGYGTFLKHVVPEDRPRLEQNFKHVLATGEDWEIDYRINRADGAVRWVWAIGYAYKSENGRPLRIAGLSMDITDRKRNEEELARAKAQAEAASRAKDEFLAVLSHELRTPLTPALITATLLESRDDLPADVREDLAEIRRNIGLEGRLIDDMLDLTRIVSGKLRLDFQSVDVHLLVRAAADICHREGQPRIKFELKASRHHVHGDGARLQQVFWNLCNNAMKFTDDAASVTVRTSDAPAERVRVEVIDTGVGIDARVLPRVFNAFEQENMRTNRQFGGLGLGLAISQKLVDAHGGTITAASEGKGQGATFTVELPTVPVAAAPAARAPGPPGASRAASPLKILLVEDHVPTLHALRKLIEQMGHRVTGASTVREATEAARRESFDLLISDLGLPDGSGLDLIRNVRDSFPGRSIALSGYGMDQDVRNSREAGFATHLTKPVDVERLEEVIRDTARGQ
ncbi:MAG TPA: ATP-binding protein [Tepidisphaeraceae bacterium]|jgi:PAS domain S-box-containing protein|nr:ATP-binding protein [Tepidisphaeraceae bacterium]